MYRRAVRLLCAALLTLALLPGIAIAKSAPTMPPVAPVRQGGPPQIQLKSLQVSATVASGVARVRMDQVFVNRTQSPAEGSYLFPLPPGAAVSSFQMFVDDQVYTAEVLDADKARSVYESIVRQNRDPALLQYIGQGLLQARVFPVPAGAERRVRVEYQQVLPRDGGLWEFALPITGDSAAQVSITATLDDLAGGSIYSPTHNVAVTRGSGRGASVSYEGTPGPGTFRLFFGKPDAEMGVNLLSYKTGSEDGYFLLLVNPPSQQAETVAKDVILLIDLSGSMQGEKFEQAKGAALQILGSLGRDDRFGVIGFHSDTVTYADGLKGAAEAPKAMQYVRDLRLGGSTNIDDAISRAQRMAGKAGSRPQVIVLLTDGQPTAGEVNPDRISARAREAATASQRIFTFGIGYDVNTVLLDALAQENRGRSDYVRPGEDLEAAVGTFWRKVGQPVLSDVALTVDGVKVDQMYPRPLPDLYLGSQMVLLGRYRSGGGGTITLSGQVNGISRRYTFKDQRFADADTSRDYIPRLWANRKVGYLLSELRRNGANQEMVGEVVALSQRFGIATPYTSFFVNEPGAPVPSAPGAAGAAKSVTQSVTASPPSGAAAVDSAKKVEQIRGASSMADTKPSGAAADSIRTAGDKTFILRDGIWTDTAYQSGDMLYFNLGSDRYLTLVRQRPDLARYLAAGSPLILADGTHAYGIDIPGKAESEAAVPAVPAAGAGAGTAGHGPSGGSVALWVGAILLAAGAIAFTTRRPRRNAH